LGDFIKEIYEDVVIEIVNMTRATLKEAIDFKTILTSEIDTGCRKMIIDLSGCEYMDSTFLGTVVVALKKIANVNGNLVLIYPKTFAYDMLHVTGSMKLFEVFESMDQALQYFAGLNSAINLGMTKKDRDLEQNSKSNQKESVRTSRSTF
jgi:anti-anti-sigma factor